MYFFLFFYSIIFYFFYFFCIIYCVLIYLFFYFIFFLIYKCYLAGKNVNFKYRSRPDRVVDVLGIIQTIFAAFKVLAFYLNDGKVLIERGLLKKVGKDRSFMLKNSNYRSVSRNFIEISNFKKKYRKECMKH